MLELSQPFSSMIVSFVPLERTMPPLWLMSTLSSSRSSQSSQWTGIGQEELSTVDQLHEHNVEKKDAQKRNPELQHDSYIQLLPHARLDGHERF